MNTIKCPECNAFLPIEEGRSHIYCSYCGASIILTNENEHIIRTIDEAGLKDAETRRMVETKRMEMREKNRASARRVLTLKIIVSIVLGIVGLAGIAASSFVGLGALLILAYIWMLSDHDDNYVDDTGERVRLPGNVSEAEGKHFAVVRDMFISAGFQNVNCIPLGDLKIGIMNKPGTVDSITINGKELPSFRKKYPPNVSVVITYHSYVEK